MFTYRIYELNDDGKEGSRQDFPVEIVAPKAMNRARMLAIDCVVELWRGSNLVATFRPEARS